MEKKVAPGALLLHNITHGLMSNVQGSAYLYDLSYCENKVTKDLVIDYTINALG